MDPSTESSPRKSGSPSDNRHRHHRKKERDHLQVNKQSLSDYIQQDWSDMTQQSTYIQILQMDSGLTCLRRLTPISISQVLAILR
jgi:hypothetical protein